MSLERARVQPAVSLELQPQRSVAAIRSIQERPPAQHRVAASSPSGDRGQVLDVASSTLPWLSGKADRPPPRHLRFHPSSPPPPTAQRTCGRNKGDLPRVAVDSWQSDSLALTAALSCA